MLCPSASAGLALLITITGVCCANQASPLPNSSGVSLSWSPLHTFGAGGLRPQHFQAQEIEHGANHHGAANVRLTENCFLARAVHAHQAEREEVAHDLRAKYVRRHCAQEVSLVCSPHQQHGHSKTPAESCASNHFIAGAYDIICQAEGEVILCAIVGWELGGKPSPWEVPIERSFDSWK